MPARGAVGDDQRRSIRAPHGGQQRELGHVDRGLIGVSAIAERACHAATTRLDGFDLQVGNEPKHLLDRFERTERFLMAVSVQQRLPGEGAQRQLQAASFGLANQKLLEQQRVGADAFCGFVRSQRKQFVAQRQETARLQADDRHPALRERRIGSDQPIEFSACVIDQAGGKKRPAATQWPAAIPGLRNVDTVSPCDQHA